MWRDVAEMGPRLGTDLFSPLPARPPSRCNPASNRAWDPVWRSPSRGQGRTCLW